jgi:hypothetical protein
MLPSLLRRSRSRISASCGSWLPLSARWEFDHANSERAETPEGGLFEAAA